MKRTALSRRTPLRATAALARRTGLGPGAWDPRTVVPPRRTPPKPARDTGPSRLVRAIVLERDGYRCARDGRPAGPGIGPYSIQHRIARGVGGTNALPNLLLLCGSGTTLCHGEVETKRGDHDRARGYWLKSHQNPRAVGVMYFERPDGPGVTAWLCDDGSLSFEAPGEAA